MQIDSVPIMPIRKRKWKPRAQSRYPLKYKHFEGSKSIGEDNDCTVCALATAAEMTYDTAHEMMEVQCGRKPKHGSNFARLLTNNQGIIGNWLVKHHHMKKDWSGPRVKGMTVRQFIASDICPKRCVISIAHHVFAVIDGVAYDTINAGARSVVHGYYSFEPVWATGKDALK